MNTFNDVVDATDGHISLREAINAANAGSDNYRIVLTGTATLSYALTGYGDDANVTGDFDILTAGRRVLITAEPGTMWPSDYATLDASQADRLFHVWSGALMLDHIILKNGRAIDNGHGSANGYGGGIQAESGTQVTLSNVSIQACSAQTGYTFGGGIFVFGGASLTIEGGDLTGNYALGGAGADGIPPGGAGGAGCTASGGALYLDIGATARISRCSISGNWVLAGAGGAGAQGRGGSGFYEPLPGGVGGAGGIGSGGFASVAAGGVLEGDNNTVNGNTCSGGAGGAGGPGGIGLSGTAAGGAGGAGGNAQDSARGIYVVSGGTVRLGAFGMNTQVPGVGGAGGTGTPRGVTGSTGSYVPCGLKCLNVSVHRSENEAGTCSEYLGDFEVNMLTTNGAFICRDVSRSSSALSYNNAGLCHTLDGVNVQVPALPYGYRRGACPPSSFSREEGEMGLSAVLTNSATLIDPLYNVPIHVSPSGGNRYPYCTWECAATNISDGESATWTAPGSVVLLAQATHTMEGNVNLGGDETVRGDGDDPSRVIVRMVGDAYCFGLMHAQARLEGVTVTGGKALWGGGGIFLSEGTVDRCMVTGNCATQYGGGIFVYGPGTVRNTLVYSNTCPQRGGGIALYGAGTVENCTVYGNSAGITGGGVYCATNGTLRNCIVWSNAAPSGINWEVSAWANADYCCTRPLLGAHSITGDPVFANAQTGDFRLRAVSPCVDAGVLQSWMTNASDLRTRPRITGSMPDIGAYELGYYSITAEVLNAYGRMTPSGVVTCLEFEEASFSMTPTSGGDICEVRVDGVSIGATNAYTFENVTSEHSIRVLFRNIIYVSPGGNSISPYADWSTSARTLAEATSAVTQASLILMSNGIYTLSHTIALADAVAIKGVNGASNTVLIGQGLDKMLVLNDALNVVDGLTISGAGPNYPAVECGSGTMQSCVLTGNAERAIWIRDGGVLRDCRVADNGEGVDLRWGRVEDSVIAGNRMYGICTGGVSNNVIMNSVIISNFGTGVIFGNGGELLNCLVAYNVYTQQNAAAGVDAQSSSVRIDNCVIVSNTGIMAGGVVTIGGTIVNSTIAGNSGTTCGGLYCALGQVLNSIIYDNRNTGMTTQRNVSIFVYLGSTTVVDHCCTTPSLGANCVTSNPGFVNPSDIDYRLAAGSPCIDAGVMAGDVSTSDFLGIARPLDGDDNGTVSVDIGAYEFIHPRADTDGDGMPDAWEVPNELDATRSNAQEDPDLDGDPNGTEYIADTRPLDGNDWFCIRNICRTNNCIIGFVGSTSRVYTLLACTNIGADTWQSVTGSAGLWGCGTNTTLVDTNAVLRQFYRVGVALPP